MTKDTFERKFYDICKKHGVVVFFNDPSVKQANNGYAIWNEVHLGKKYRNVSIYMAVAFHEFSHAIINMKRAKNVKSYFVNSSFNEEFSAWTLAMRYYAKYFGKPFNKIQGNFILECLKTHAKTAYSFKDVYHDKIVQEKLPS